jgi:hypothetical protein
MRVIKHITEQPFIFATGLAALVHSTWALATLFGGEAPQVIDTASGFKFAYWLLPAMLIAFALDVGQISTSAEIRAGHNDYSKYFTFLVFALATYYLQWLYIAHHMPELELAPGISDYWRPVTASLRDLGMWIIPAFLPLSTTLYTVSARHENTAENLAAGVHVAAAPAVISVPPLEAAPVSLPEPEEDTAQLPAFTDEVVEDELPDWLQDGYVDPGVRQTDSPLVNKNGRNH